MSPIEHVKDLKELIDLCKKTGLQSFKGFGVELEFLAEAVQPKRRVRAGKDSEKVETPDQYSSDDALFWSATDPSLEGHPA